eukprot:13638450-Ditylum_brightwellii.AAC.1
MALIEPTTGTSQSGARTSAQAGRASRAFGRRNGSGNSDWLLLTLVITIWTMIRMMEDAIRELKRIM